MFSKLIQLVSMSFMKRICPLLMAVVFLVGCEATSERQKLMDQTAPIEVETSVVQAREEFVFAELPELLRQFGYTGFCPTPEKCDWRLPYGLYNGMRGYFEEAQPIAVDGDTEIYRVRFQTGETYYYFASRRLGGKYAPVAPIIPSVLQEQVDAFTPEPLVSCSQIWLVDARIEFGRLLYRLSNNQTITPEKLEVVRQVSKLFGNQEVVLAERLLEVAIRHAVELSKSSPVIQIEPMGEVKANDLRLTLQLSEGEVRPVLRAQYFGESWIYLRMLEFQADQRLWQRWGLRVRRHEQHGQVREWVELPAGEAELAIVEALAGARNARVRFEGARVYVMLNLTRESKEELKRMLVLYQVLVMAAEQPTVPSRRLEEPASVCTN